MVNAIERVVGIAYLIVGVSHVLQPRAWAEFFVQLRAKGDPGALISGMLTLNFGLLVVGFHGNVWTGLSALVTAIGWASVFKGALHMCIPRIGLRSMALVDNGKEWRIAVSGGMFVPVALTILYGSMR